MKKTTVQVVLQINPTLTVEDAKRAIPLLERTPPLTLEE